MRYYTTPPELYSNYYGKTYKCNHPIYTFCTLYLIKGKGLAVIQQKYNPLSKHVWWQEVDECYRDMLYLNPGFMSVFEEFASEPDDKRLYPTITLRQMMWYLRMKPLKREVWETTFDKKPL